MKRLEALFPYLSASPRNLSYLKSVMGQAYAVQFLLDQLPNGFILLNSNLEVIYMNRISRERLVKKSGLYLKEFRIHASLKSEEEQWQRAIVNAVAASTASNETQNNAGEILLIHSAREKEKRGKDEERSRELQILIRPVFIDSSGLNSDGDWTSLMDGNHNHFPVVQVMIFDTSREVSNNATALLQALYNLTSAEASLAMALAEGRTPEEYAAFYGITPHTPRQQLKSIYKKMGVHRQVDVVRLLLSGPVGWTL